VHGKPPVEIITAYRRKKNKYIENWRNRYVRKKQLQLVNHYYRADSNIKTTEYKKIENAFQHEGNVQK